MADYPCRLEELYNLLAFVLDLLDKFGDEF